MDEDVDPSATTGDDGRELADDVGALDAIEAALDDVETALVRLDDGSYGRCEVCGDALDDAQLAQAPAARHCRAHLPIPLP